MPAKAWVIDSHRVASHVLSHHEHGFSLIFLSMLDCAFSLCSASFFFPLPTFTSCPLSHRKYMEGIDILGAHRHSFSITSSPRCTVSLFQRILVQQIYWRLACALSRMRRHRTRQMRRQSSSASWMTRRFDRYVAAWRGLSASTPTIGTRYAVLGMMANGLSSWKDFSNMTMKLCSITVIEGRYCGWVCNKRLTLQEKDG
jgi:hypothetical protein